MRKQITPSKFFTNLINGWYDRFPLDLTFISFCYDEYLIGFYSDEED